MLDTIRAVIAEALEISTSEVNQIREALLAEQTTADARYAATTALIHPEGSTTPVDQAYGRAQQRVADLRKKAVKDLPKAIASLIALEVAMQRQDEAKTHRDMIWDKSYAKDTLGVDPAVADYWKRLVKHGVHPSYLGGQANEMVAIIADLLSWKAKDAMFRDADNPWREVLAIYANRRIEQPSATRHGKAKRSVRGTPARDRHIKDERLGDYMFNEKFAELPPVRTPAPSSEPPAAAVGPTFDCSVYPGDDGHAVTGVAKGAPVDEDDLVKVLKPATALAADEDRSIGPASIDHKRALEIARAVYATDPIQMSIFWPAGWTDQEDFEPTRLIPALEAQIASGDDWSGITAFLAAVREGQGRDFIAQRRAQGIKHLARLIVTGDEKALSRVRRAGIEI